MKRLKDGFVDIIEQHVGLKNKVILEIGCGNGARSPGIAKKCSRLLAIDPNKSLIHEAINKKPAHNIDYSVGQAEDLKFKNSYFDIVIFSLSFHHVALEQMSKALTESARVCKSSGHIIIFEPSWEGTFFEAELYFDASDGDERREKAMAYYTLLSHKGIKEQLEIYDQTLLQFESPKDFMDTMNPKKNLDYLTTFLEHNNYTLDAQRRINICKKV